MSGAAGVCAGAGASGKSRDDDVACADNGADGTGGMVDARDNDDKDSAGGEDPPADVADGDDDVA